MERHRSHCFLPHRVAHQHGHQVTDRGGQTETADDLIGVVAQVLKKLGRHADEIAACRDFLKRHGSSLYAAKVRARLTELTTAK